MLTDKTNNFKKEYRLMWGFSSGNAGDTRDTGSNPGLGISPGVGNGRPLQYSCMENFMDRGAWRATVHGIAKSWT